MRFPIVLALVLSAGVARADDNTAPLYHVQQETFGCANPSYTRTLTNPQESRRNNRRWVRNAMNEGRCVTVTPRSPWKLVSLEGDVALMSYAGGSGPPGAYYLSVADVVDSDGQHPGGAPAAPQRAASNPAPAPAQPNNTSATALAPPPVNPSSNASGSYSDLPPLPPPAEAPQSSELTEISWILAVTGFIVLAAILVWHGRRLSRIERSQWNEDEGLLRVSAQLERDQAQYPGGGPGGYPAGGGGG